MAKEVVIGLRTQADVASDHQVSTSSVSKLVKKYKNEPNWEVEV